MQWGEVSELVWKAEHMKDLPQEATCMGLVIAFEWCNKLGEGGEIG